MGKGWVSIQRFSICALLACAFITAGTGSLSANPLDEATCERLRSERKALSVLGIDKFFDQGADWVSGNLTAADLNLVKRYVNVFEQLKFRCPAQRVAKAKAKPAYRGPIPPLPVRAPQRSERAAKPASAAQPG